MVASLEAKPELNGRRGVIKSYMVDKGRYAVALVDGASDAQILEAPILLKADNLVKVSASSGSGAADDATLLSAEQRETLALVHAELAQVLLYHRRATAAEAEIESAKATLGFGLELIGALGKRTKFQENEISQLTLRAHLGAQALPRPQGVGAAEWAMLPRYVDEEDDTLLATLHLSEQQPEPTLRPAEQLILLGTLNLLRISRPADQATQEEIEPYVERALTSPQSWAVQTAALRARARLQSDNKRRRHRSLMQLQALADDLDATGPGSGFLARHQGPAPPDTAAVEAAAANDPTTPASEPTPAASTTVAAARLHHFWAADLAPRWKVRVELARTMAALGLFTEATALFGEQAAFQPVLSSMVRTHG